MAEGDIYWSPRGRDYRLGPPVAGGGDGVYSVPLSRQVVARIHHDGTGLAVSERKVQAMLKRPPALPDIVEDGEHFVRMAWPVASLHDKSGKFTGFLMPAVDMQTTSPVESLLQESQARAEGLPTSLGAKMNLAARLAVAINELHEQGHRVVYLTPAKLRFYRQSLHLAVIDCERFSVRADNQRFAADPDAAVQNVSDYLAPEFQNKPIPRDNEESQDRFAMAVVVFQLLNFGIHPFTGIPTHDQVPADIPGRIAGNLYAYGAVPNPDLEPSLGSGHLAMPKELKSLFDRAFAGKANARPQAQEWATWLPFYAIPSNDAVVVCQANSRHHHFVNLPCAACARAVLFPGTEDSPVEDQPADPVKASVPAFLQPERASQPARVPPPKLPQRPVQPSASLSLRSVALIVATLVVVFVAGSYSGVFRTSPATDSKATAADTDPANSPAMPAASPTDSDLAAFPALQQDEALTDGYVTTATVAIATDDRFAWQRAIMNLHTDAPAHAPAAPSEFRAEFASFSAGLSPASFNERRRQGLLNNLRRELRHDPYDDESAYELGWLSLVAGDRSGARKFFLHAIWVNPDRANAWYGLGVIGANDNQKVGGLVTAELLTTDPTQAESMRKAFPPLLLQLCSIRPDDFAGLQAQARLLADHYRPLVAPPVSDAPAM
jgi:hypothetical protein